MNLNLYLNSISSNGWKFQLRDDFEYKKGGGGGRAPSVSAPKAPSIGGSTLGKTPSNTGSQYIVGGGIPTNRAPFLGTGLLFAGGGYYLGSRRQVNRNSCTCECINSNGTVVINKTIEKDEDVELGNNTESLKGFVVCYGIQVSEDFDPCNNECPTLSESSSPKTHNLNLLILFIFIISAVLSTQS
ncbi:hypothetical protein AYI70_g4242 [Smittium culicis]|uniref:Uncharacterized protein n=1 Tax=Smittium culicis TaxID=133412 RepID=A0A1R1Y057_9FUNG|nr:hypothetical protein AYI70_g4242 [Smittium culicis]